MPSNSKRTRLFAVLTGHFSESIMVKQHFTQRMNLPPNVDLQVLNITQLEGHTAGGCVMVEMCFPSYTKARKARDMLDRSNKGLADHVYCYFDEAEALGRQLQNTSLHDSEKDEPVKEVYKIRVGRYVFLNFVGPKNENMHDIERQLKAVCNDTDVFIKTDAVHGEISLQCVDKFKDDAVKLLENTIEQLQDSLLRETRRRNVNVYFEVVYGEGCEIIKVMVNGGQHYNKHINKTHQYTIKMRWCRRPAKGVCYVYLDCCQDRNKLLRSKLYIGTAVPVNLWRSRKQSSDITITGFDPYAVTKEKVKAALEKCLGKSLPDDDDQFKLILPREEVCCKPYENQRICKAIDKQVSQIVDTGHFDVHVMECRDDTVFFQAFMNFRNAQSFQQVAKSLRSAFVIDFKPVESLYMMFDALLYLSQEIFEAVKLDIDDYIRLSSDASTHTKFGVRTLKSGDICIKAETTSPIKATMIKLALDTIIKGDVIEEFSKSNLHFLFKTDGQEKIEQFQRESGAVITKNDKTMKLAIQGHAVKRKHAKQLISDYLAKLSNASERSISFQEVVNYPPGFIKSLMTKYGYDLSDLKSSSNLVSAEMNLHGHAIILSGDMNSLEKADDAIRALKEELVQTERNYSFIPDATHCPVCLGPVDDMENQRLENCSHDYCKICLISLIKLYIKLKKFPMKCIADQCDKSLVIADIKAHIDSGEVIEDELMESALSSFVKKNSTEYKFCVTQGCNVLCKTTAGGTRFYCFRCLKELCTQCHIPSDEHDDEYCEIFQTGTIS